MVISDLGIDEADFINNAYNDFKVTVVRQPVVKSYSNNSGSITRTYNTPENIDVIFTKRSQTFDWAKEGLFEGGDAFMQCLKDQSLEKDDLIEFDGKIYRVNTILKREIGGAFMFKSCNLYVVED